jgi:hypothetical protein
MKDGSELLPFVRFDADERKIVIMPHSKEEVGIHYVTLRGDESSDGEEELYIEETFKITVESNFYSAFKTTPGPVTISIGDKTPFSLPSISNDADLDYKLKMTSGPDWAAYSTSSKKFTFSPDLEEYIVDETIELGNYEVWMNWNAESELDYTGSYAGVEILNSGASENFYQPYVLDVVIQDMPSKLVP